MAAMCASSAVFSALPASVGSRKGRSTTLPVICSLPAPHSAESVVDRRQLLLAAGSGSFLGCMPFSTAAAAAAAATEIEGSPSPSLYTDPENLFSLEVPAGWESGEGQTGSRRVVGFYPKGDSVTNVSLVITILGADYTSLSSFGRVDDFSENLVNSLDRSWKRPPGQSAKLVSAKAANDMYYVNYSLQPVGEAKRQLVSAVAVKGSEYYNRLFTLTGQYLDSDAATLESLIKRVGWEAGGGKRKAGAC